MNNFLKNQVRRGLQVLCYITSVAFGVTVEAGAPFGQAVPVEVITAKLIELAPDRLVSGTVISRDDANLSSEIKGRIVSLVQFGEAVAAGQVLATIDHESLDIRLDEARAEVVSLDAKLKFFDAETDRLDRLAKDNHAAKNLLEERVSERDETRGMLSMAKARIAEIKHNLARSTTAAPFAGVIVERFAEVGEWVDAGDILLRLASVEHTEIRGRIRQESVALIAPGERLSIASKGESLLGVVKTLVPVGDEVSRLYEMRIDFERASWRAGRAVRIKVPTAKPKTVLALPRDSLVIRENVIKVFRILDDQSAEAVVVSTGITDQKWVEIIGDIKAGDQIVIRGNERLRPRQTVYIRESDGTRVGD